MNDRDTQSRVRQLSLDRRGFLAQTAGLGGAALASSLGADGLLAADRDAPQNTETRANKKKAPFKVLYSNDTTHILTCTSPYHRKGEAFRQEMLEGAVDETAGTGIDVHILQPGVGVVPWWKSKQYPYEEHIRWFEKTYGIKMDDNLYAQYMLDGGDMAEAFVRRCRRKGLTPFVSLRLNDRHGKEFVDRMPNADPMPNIPGFALHCLNRFYKEHPEYRLGTSLSWSERGLDWARVEVREWMFGFARELCEGYDMDGFELDFMRKEPYFRVDQTTRAQRVAIMTGFVDRVRKLLDRTSTSGRRRWLCVRVPASLRRHDAMGVDLPRWVDAGVDMVNLSSRSFTSRNLVAIRKMVPDTSLHLEMYHSTRSGKRLSPGYDTMTYRRTTDQQFYTTMHRAYARGLDGASFFNFPYYRQHGHLGRGPFHEPPFHIMRHMGDPAWLAKQPQHYFVASRNNLSADKPRGQALQASQSMRHVFDMAPPTGGWRKDGKLRIQAADDLGDSRWTARFNGHELEETDDRSEPYEQPYSGLIGTPEQHRAWTVPAGLAKDGANRVDIKLVDGGNATVVFLDLAIS